MKTLMERLFIMNLKNKLSIYMMKCIGKRLIRLVFAGMAFATILFSCSPQDEAACIDGLFARTDSLKHVVLNSGEHLWGNPFSIRYVDSLLLVYDEMSGDKLFHLVNPLRPDNVTSFGEKGQGKDEFLMPMECLPCNDSTATIYDYASKKLFEFVPGAWLRGGSGPVACYRDTFPGTVKLFKTKFNTAVSFGFYDDCMFYLQDKNNKLLQKFGEFPYRDASEKQVASSLRGMAYQGILQNNPSNDKFVYAVNSAEILYFYEVGASSVRQVCSYGYSYPDYKPLQEDDSKSAALSAENPRTFVDVTADDRLVYLLYSGKNFKESRMKAFEGNILYVFDWTGKPQKKYVLDIPVTRLCIDGQGNVIYAFANNPDPELVKFEL